jgi:hypothetical protein
MAICQSTEDKTSRLLILFWLLASASLTPTPLPALPSALLRGRMGLRKGLACLGNVKGSGEPDSRTLSCSTEEGRLPAAFPLSSFHGTCLSLGPSSSFYLYIWLTGSQLTLPAPFRFQVTVIGCSLHLSVECLYWAAFLRAVSLGPLPLLTPPP